MIDLIFDTETTGFPLWRSPPSNTLQPHLVQLAVITAKGDDLILKWDTIIKCPIKIPEPAANVHGITQERSQEEGVELVEAIRKFDQLLSSVDRIICHNTKFDFKIMEYAYHRAGVDSANFLDFPQVCTMKTARPVLHSGAKLSEAYARLVDSAGFSSAHTADADTMACWKVLRALEARGVELL